MVKIKVVFEISHVPESDIRYQASLAGGAMMDLGCYCVSVIRTLVKRQGRIKSMRVLSAVAVHPVSPMVDPSSQSNAPSNVDTTIDSAMDVEMEFELEEGQCIQASLRVDMASPIINTLKGPRVYITGKGQSKAKYLNFIMPHLMHSISVTEEDGKYTTIKDYGDDHSKSTYAYQLDAFVSQTGQDAGQCARRNVEESIENMELIDLIYEKAGMKPRMFKE